MLTKLFANMLGSIIKSSGVDTNIYNRNFNIKKTLSIIGVTILFAIVGFLINRVSILSRQVIDYQDNYKCVKIVKKAPKVPIKKKP